MRKYLSLVLCLLIGVNVFAQNQVLKAVAATSNQNFKIAETPLMTKVSNTQANSLGETYLGNEAFYTNYDRQSNSFISNRMYQNKNGDVAVVAMQSDDESSAAADRGTGYNFYKNGKILEGGDQFQKIEANATGADMRTGWPSIAPYGAEGEIMVCHTGNGLVYYTRTKAGEGVWDGPYNVPNLKADTTDLSLAWSKIITTGANNETLHIFAAATTDDGTAHLYLRSSDLQNWEYSWAPCSLHNLHVGVYGGDDYAVAANGDVIAVVYNNWQKAHTMLYKSSDNGNTWESKIVWENPIHLLDWETDENTLFEEFSAPTHVSVALDKYGDAHVALSVGMFYHNYLGTNYAMYYGLLADGVAYWYEAYGMPLQSPDGNPWNALRLWWDDEENPGNQIMNPQNFCAWMPPHKEDGFNGFDVSKQYVGLRDSLDYILSFCASAYPSIAVDPAGNIAVAYSAPDLNLGDLWYDSQTGNEYYYRSLFVNYKPAGTTDWTSVTVYGQSLDECTYVTAVSNPVNENEFWFSCLSDDTPGFHYGNSASQDHITTSTVNVFKFCPDGIDEDFEGIVPPLTISVNPANSGNVTIAGANMLGKTVTLSATPNEGYRFLNWTENGEVVSTNAQYSFTISKEMNLVANFIIDTYVPPMKNVAKECVLIEAFTGINCAYCPAAAVAITQMINEDLPIAPLAFHSSYFTPSNYDYATSETDSRSSWYKVTGYPTVIIDGVGSHAGGGPASAYSSVYDKVKEEYEKRVNIGSPYEIELIYENTLNEGVAKAVVKKVNDNASNDVRLFIALAESHIQQNWGGGLSELNAVVRDILTSTSGVKLVGNINEYTASFSFNNEWNKENCYIVAWVQDVDSKEVYQAVKISVDSESYPEQPDDDDNTATAPSMRLKNIVSSDGLESYDYIYPSETSTRTTCVNEYDFLSNTENIDSIFYDERGNITKIATWTKIDGQWFYACYVDYTYNDKNLRTSRANYNDFGYGPELGGVYNYKYDDEGRMIEWSLKLIVDEYQKAIIEYDEEGRKISETIQQYNFETYYLENAFLTEYEYDENGNCVKEAEFGYELNSGNWVPNQYRLYEYDEFDNCILMENRTANGTVQERRIYTYDLSILAENVFYYPNPEEDFPQLPEAKTHLLKSFEYFAQNDEGELTYVITYFMGYDVMHSNNHWTPDESLYANNMTIITTIEIDGEEQYNTNLELGAFCNGELRGSARLQYVDAPANRYECFLMVYGNSGDDITFRLYDHSTGLESDLKSNEVVDFEVNATIGDVVNPYTINFKSTEVHTQALLSGWNWYSTYIINEGEEGLANLEAAVGTNGIQIKNQTKFVNQASGNWYGTLTSTAVEDMFMIQMSAAHTLNLEGYVVNTAEHPITLGTNWKWISYPLAAEMSVEEAFAGANPSNGDYVKSQKGFAQYYEGLGWSGTLKTMTPGMGYMYQNTSGYAKTLVYPMANAKSKAEAEVEENLHWTANATKYPMNMTLIAVVDDAARDYEVAAFSNGECRGAARPVYIEALGQSMIFMTIYGDDKDAVTFRYYDVTTGEEVMLNDEMTFEVNATHGDIMQPYVMTMSTMGIDETSSGFSIYPNPVQDKLYIETEAEIEEIVVYDVYGRVQNLRNSETQKLRNSIDVSNLNSGVYFVQIKTEEGNITKRFVKE